ncbi:SDR family oxidoreductase [Conexibacter sp. SYSU D00693]|uniref:SDR family oxidoreductase n=1 Tax=Conexibacter sp. SYSU D00693 TaxID=2812560 RepID=UPI00196B51A4|nr:SDR family oxidoreductase [Conexibacter sp. SYSU D00693]
MAGRVVAVTGGGRGIGAAIALRLARAGHRVAVGDLDGELARQAAADAGRDALGLELDVTSRASYVAFLDAVDERLGPVDVLVANAGVMWVGRFEDEPDEVARRQVDVNLHGVLLGMKVAAPRMLSRGHGHLIAMASAASKVTPPGEATYAATKHAVLGYCSAVREELRGSGVEVSVVMPGVVETALAAGTSSGPAARRLTPEAVAKAVHGVLDKPRFEVHVPPAVGVLTKLRAVLPRAAADALHRAVVPDQLAQGDPAARRSYEHRALGPGAPPAD